MVVVGTHERMSTGDAVPRARYRDLVGEGSARLASVSKLAAMQVRDPCTHVMPNGQPAAIPRSIMVGGLRASSPRGSAGAVGHDAMATKAAGQLAERTRVNEECSGEVS